MSDPLRAGPEDLAANRAGRLGPGQLREQARRRRFAAAKPPRPSAAWRAP